MDDNKYSKKEIEIFEGFDKLLQNKIDPSKIKVSDIAKYSKVGKGTVYEYFKTKEEVIAKSIIYKLNKEFEEFMKRCEEANGFENKCKTGYEELARIINNRFLYFQILISSEEIYTLIKYLSENNQCRAKFKNYVERSLESTIRLGIEEGKINTNLDVEYIKNVFISVGGGIAVKAHIKQGNMSEEDIQTQKQNSYTMLIKSLS